MTLKEIGDLVLGLLLFFLAFKIWQHGDKISASSHWFIGFLSYILCILAAFNFLFDSGIFNK